jgi:hypothetical protein
VVPEGVVVDEICSSRDLFEERLIRLARKFNEGRGLLMKSFFESRNNSIYMEMIDDLIRRVGDAPNPLRAMLSDVDLPISHALSCLPSDQRLLRILAARADRVNASVWKG